MAEDNITKDAQNTSETSKKKRKWNYHLMLFMDNDNGEIKQMGIGRTFVEVVAAIIAVIFIVAVIGWGVNSANRQKLVMENEQLTAKLEEMQTQINELTSENDALNSKVTVLSDTVITKVEKENAIQEENDAAHLPEGFPLSASASMVTDENDPMTIIFSCSAGANIISAGAGTVLEVIPDANYDFCVRIDHDNGYITEYYNASTPLVKEGDQVLEGSILYVVEDGKDKLAYKVTLDGKAIDPMSIIKIDG